MYDKNWPHGHTFNGTKCRVLADNLTRTHDDYSIAVAFFVNEGKDETVQRVRAQDLTPAPAPKRRIRGWTAVYASGQLGQMLRETLEDAKALNHWFPVAAYVYIDVEEGKELT